VAIPGYGLLRAGMICVLLMLPASAMGDLIFDEPGDYPFVSAAYTVLPEADFESAGTGSTVQTKENQLVAGFTRFSLGELDLDVGVDYQYTRYVYENIDGRHRDLHRLQIPLGFTYGAATWNLTGFVAPGVATSSNVMKDLFDQGGSDDLVVTGRIEASAPHGRKLGWLGGLAHDRAFGEDKTYPVVGLLYQPNDRLSLRLAYPDPAIRFLPNDRHSLSLRLFPSGSEWHVVGDQFNYDFDYQVEAIRLQGVWSHRFCRSGWLDLSLGYEFDRRHRFVDDSGKQIDSTVDSQFLLMLGLLWGDGPVPFTHEVSR
jgi:hypothetical protein